MKLDPITQRYLLCMYEIIATKEQGCHNIATFCKKVKMNSQAISYFRSGERTVSINDIVSINKHFKYSPNWIILEKGEKKL